MKITRFASATVLLLAVSANVGGQTDARTTVAGARQRIESTDSRATGHLVQVDATGKRTSNDFSIKAHWFPGVLRVLLEVRPSRRAQDHATQDPTAKDRVLTANAAQDQRLSILFEMRPEGRSSIRVLRPQQAEAVVLPADRWSESVAGSAFDYEDFLQPEFYWQDQTMLKSVKFGTHDCDVLKSSPSAADHSHYAQVQTWLDHATGYPLFVEKTLKEGSTVKDFTSLGVTQTGGVWAARQVEVKVHGRPGTTLLIFDRGSTKAHLTAKDFSPEKMSHFEDHP